MIISALCKYYQFMVRRGVVLPESYSKIRQNYLVCLTPEGKVGDILFCGEKENKKFLFPEIIVPKRSQKPGIESNIVEHRPLYLFGLAADKGILRADDAKAIKSHAAFREASLAFFNGIDSEIARAFYLFAETWNPEEETENEKLLRIVKDYNTAYFSFCMLDDLQNLLHTDEKVKEKWEAEYESRQAQKTSVVGECSVYGIKMPIAALHDKIKGVKGGQSSGCTLVCFNNRSESSYDKEQSFNGPVSEKAMREYTQALNYLLADEKHHTYVGDMTIVHFAMTEQEDPYLAQFNEAINPTQSESLSKSDLQKVAVADKGLSKLSGLGTDSSQASGEWSDNSSRNATNINFQAFDRMDDRVRYCIFGLVPNAARISVRFFYENNFGELRKNIERYHRDFAIGKATSAPAFWRIAKEIVSPKSKNEKPNNCLTQGLFQSMIQGSPIPYQLLATIVNRVRTDSDDPENGKYFIKINDTRMGIIKAYLNRKLQQEEPITVSLDENRKNPAYLCGRLFATLEKIQQEATDAKLNKTIKDAYFSSAMATPSAIFPRLIKLSNYHMGKLAEKRKVGFSILLNRIMGELSEMPKTLTLEEQGNFILGYYHQNQNFYTKQNDNQEE